jgi:formylglycine-generating enzyme required for sulfatase activity
MMRCSKEGRLDEMLVAHELLTTRRSKMPKPLSTLILDSRQFDDRRDRIIPFRQAWLTFARGCVSRLDREGLRTAVRHLRNDPMFARNHGDVVVRWLWLHFAEESMLRGDRDAANEALQCAKLCGAPPERIAALAEPDGAAIRVASGLQRLRAGAVAEAAVAVFDALAIDRDAAIAALQELEAAPLLAVALDSCQARFERAVTDEDWAAATEADSLARCLAPGSGSWLTEVLTGTRLQALGAEFVASLPAAAAAALPAASIEALLPVHNSIGMEFALVAGGQVVIDRDEPASPAAIDVTITGPFFVGLAPVTFAQWKRVMGSTRELDDAGPDGVDTAANSFQRVPVVFGADAPVHSRTWAEAEEFCRRLTDLPEERAAGHVYRMPSEAEWIHGVTSVASRATGSAMDLPGPTPGGQAADQGRSEPSDDELGGQPVGALRPAVAARQPVWEWVSGRLDVGDVPATGRIIDPRAQEGVGVTQPVLRKPGHVWPPEESGKGSLRTTTAASSSDPSIGFRVVMVMQPTTTCEDAR